MTAHDDASEAMRLVELLKLPLADQPAQVQGAVLADLLAMWLSGHVVRGDPKATERLRERMLKQHLKAVKALIPVNYAGLIEPQLKRETH
jgi:hypothetical protein